MPDMRFQVLVNGKQFCVAGVDGFGVVSAGLSWVRRDPDQYARMKAESEPTWSTSPEEWAREAVGMVVTSLPYFPWGGRELSVGDEVTIRVLGPGETAIESDQESSFDVEVEFGKPIEEGMT